MNGFPQDFAADTKHGLDWDFRPSQGTFFITEGTYQWSATDEQRCCNGRLPGRVTVGAYGDTGPFDLLDGSGGTSRGLGSVYAIGQQKLWEPEAVSDRGLQAWIATTHAWKEEIAPYPWFLSGGLVWFGPTESRQKRSTGTGIRQRVVQRQAAWADDRNRAINLLHVLHQRRA